MTHAAHIEEETRPSLIGLALAPLVLLCVWFKRFADWTVTLKRVRKAQLVRCNPAEHWPGLRRSEWLMEQIRAEGVRRVLADRDPDLDHISAIVDPPEGYGACPKTAWEMNRRFAALAAFHADPEAAIRRSAARIVAREGACDPLGNRIAPGAACPAGVNIGIDPYSVSPPTSPPIRVVAPAQRVRAPP
jgi:hypothetical protein